VSGTAASAAAVKRGVLPSAGNIVVKFRGVADEAAVVLLPGKGFDTPHPSARVSLARLSEGDYTRIGHVLCATMDDCFAEFQTGARNGGLDCRLQHRWQPQRRGSSSEPAASGAPVARSNQLYQPDLMVTRPIRTS